MYALRGLALLMVAFPAVATAGELFFRGSVYYETWYDLGDVRPSRAKRNIMEISFETDGTYELTSWGFFCDDPEVSVGVWTALDDRFVIEDYYGFPMYGRFLGDRAGALYLDPEGEWIAWSLVRPGAKPWYRPVLFGVRTDDSRLEATLFDDGTCWVKEYSPTCLPLTALDDCTWSLDPVSGLPQLETSEGRYLPSPIGEPGCFHYDDGGLGVDVCVY